MLKLKNAIKGKKRWDSLNVYISLIDKNKNSNSNVALDGAKSILESISKTILEDKGIKYNSNSEIKFLIKKCFEALPVFSKLSTKDINSAKSILGSFENISRVIGEFRNTHGFFSHGRDLQSEKFDRYLVELVISSSDLVASFLVISHSTDLKDRSRIYYEEHNEFNHYLDSTIEEYPIVLEFEMQPSIVLFTDTNAYQEKLNLFINEKSELILKIETIELQTISSELENILSFRDYLTAEEELRVAQVVLNNLDNINFDEANEHMKPFINKLYKNNKNILTSELIINIQNKLDLVAD